MSKGGYKRPSYKRTVIISDIHAPYHDVNAINALLSFLTWFLPHTVIFIGDVVDFYAVSSFDKDPQRRLELQNEIDEAVGVMQQVKKACPKAKEWYFIKGNHEQRLQRYLWSKAAELSGLREMNVKHMLKLGSMGIEYVEYGKMIYNGLMIKHGDVVRKYSGYTARAEIEKVGISGVSGHTHRMSLYHQTNEAGAFTWMEIGHLAREDQEYLEGSQPNWQQGFGVILSNQDYHRLIPVPVKNGVAEFGEYEFY